MSQFEEEKADLSLKYDKISIEDAGVFMYNIIMKMSFPIIFWSLISRFRQNYDFRYIFILAV